MEAAEPSVAIDAAGDAIVVWAYFDGTHALIQAALHPAAGSFSSPPTVLSDAGRNSGQPEIAVDDAGDAVAAWAQVEGAAQTIHAAVHPAAGSFQAGELISSPTAFANGPQVMMTLSGLTTVAWTRSHGEEATVEAVTQPTAGSFSAPEAVPGELGEDPLFPRFAMSSDGDVVMVWSATASPNKIVRASVRPSGGSFSPPTSLSATRSGIFRPTVTIDEDGSATAVWTRPRGKTTSSRLLAWTPCCPVCGTSRFRPRARSARRSRSRSRLSTTGRSPRRASPSATESRPRGMPSPTPTRRPAPTRSR